MDAECAWKCQAESRGTGVEAAEVEVVGMAAVEEDVAMVGAAAVADQGKLVTMSLSKAWYLFRFLFTAVLCFCRFFNSNFID